MTQANKSLLAFAFLLVSSAPGALAQSAPRPQAAAQGITPAELDERYRRIWNTVRRDRDQTPSPLPAMVAHLGASAGNQITVWVKSENGRNAGARDWGLTCQGTDAVSVREEVHDRHFGVSKLAVTRNDGNTAALLCELSMGGSTSTVTIPVLPPALIQEPFSFLAYSCNEPFSTDGRDGILARDLSLWLRMHARATGENSRGKLPERPQFVLGVGDQIYVDPDPDADQPLAFFKGDCSKQFLIRNDPESLYEALDFVYRYNFSLPPLAWTFSKLPSYMMWDDHEIRDGWGSQGDELREPMRSYFRIARHAFIAHQLLRSYAPGAIDQRGYDALVAGSETLHRQFSYGERTHALMLDSRSTRAPGREIFEDTARQAVQEWLARGRSGQGDLYVLTVGVPLFPSRTLTVAGGHNIADDLRDGWDSRPNRESRARLLEMLANHFAAEENKSDRLLVISGDVHYSSLYFLSLNGRVIGQEVITSGIAHSLPWIARKLNWALDSASRVGPFQVYAGGKINESASFAELSVNQGPPDQAPDVNLVFHTNGTLAGGGWQLGNTNLLVAPQNRPLWYHKYQYNYTDEFEHLAEASRVADRDGAIPAGSIMPLPLGELPQMKTTRSFFQRLRGRESVWSAIQAQSVFCTVLSTSYNTTLAHSWNLNELTSRTGIMSVRVIMRLPV